ncbi:MAG: DUF6660 family protein [Bacteroidota bacterium]|nr:DUF6660 family protein [Bacteroidota bacterium]
MKVLTVILSFYFLALNIVPCGDSVQANGDSQVVSVVDFDGDHGQDGELCSPFCQCHCCHVHTIDFGILEFEPIQVDISNESFVHFDKHGKDFTPSLYQPPKV